MHGSSSCRFLPVLLSRLVVRSARYQEYEELERDMPGINSSGIEQHFQPTESLWNFQKLSKKRYEIWPLGQDGRGPRKSPCFERFTFEESTLRGQKGVKCQKILLKQFGSFSAKIIIPGFCVLILLVKRHKHPKQVNLTQNSVIQLKLYHRKYFREICSAQT